MLHLTDVQLKALSAEQTQSFPFHIASIQSLHAAPLRFSSPVTFFIGENGSGKSTLLEALALAARSINVGSENLERDQSLEQVEKLARQLKLGWTKRTQRGFFLRSEDFFGYAKRMQRIREEAEAELRAIDSDTSLSVQSRLLARQPHANTAHAIKRRYGAGGLDGVSHGESFFTLFQSRFVANGLYLLDEPEAPLSPRRQLALLMLIKRMASEEGAQFIIATHSPILMAYPAATIYSFDGGQITALRYEEIDHVQFTKDFLNNPALFLRHI